MISEHELNAIEKELDMFGDSVAKLANIGGYGPATIRTMIAEIRRMQSLLSMRGQTIEGLQERNEKLLSVLSAARAYVESMSPLTQGVYLGLVKAVRAAEDIHVPDEK